MNRAPGPRNHPDEVVPGAATESRNAGKFRTTLWTLVLAAGQAESPEASAALEQLCRLYWPPLYSFLRRSGFEPESASDLTQQFFLKLLENESIRKADQERGRFRSYLLTSLKNFVADEHRTAHRLKRGGPHGPLSLDALNDRERAALEPADTYTPAQAFDQQWAKVTLDEAARRHQDEYVNSEQQELFDRLRRLHSMTESNPSYAVIAAEMGVPLGTLKSLANRFRHRYREHIRAVIAETVATPDEVEDEIRYLLQVFSR